MCRLHGVSKDTVNRVSSVTAEKIFRETKPSGEKPMQFLSQGDFVRSLHGAAYTRLWNADVLDAVREAAPEFVRPQTASGGGTGLYAGEPDMFAFLIDPGCWVEISSGEAFAPGFFVWNSEVGKRSIGVQTFWCQSICANHIVWGATEVEEFTRKHTANVKDSLTEIRGILRTLLQKRDERKDSFYKRGKEPTASRKVGGYLASFA